MGLLYHYRRPKSPRADRVVDPALTLSLVGCVEAIKSYLDVFLAFDPSTHEHLPFEEWCRVIMAFFILYKLSAGHQDIPHWNANLCRDIINLDEYLRRTIAQLTVFVLPDSEEPTSQGIFYVLPQILESARTSYILARDEPNLQVPGARVHIDLNETKISAKSPASELHTRREQTRCPATGLWAAEAMCLGLDTSWHGITSNREGMPLAQLDHSEKMWKELLNAGNTTQ
jgi:hypothetical protein